MSVAFAHAELSDVLVGSRVFVGSWESGRGQLLRSRPLSVTGEPARYAILHAQSITPLVISRNAPLGDARRFVEGTQRYVAARQSPRTALRSCSAN